MTLRMGVGLADRAAACAAAVDLTLVAWVRLVLRRYGKDWVACVEDWRDAEMSTRRKDSTVIRLDGVQHPAADLRRMIYAAVLHCEPQMQRMRWAPEKPVAFEVSSSW